MAKDQTLEEIAERALEYFLTQNRDYPPISPRSFATDQQAAENKDDAAYLNAKAEEGITPPTVRGRQ